MKIVFNVGEVLPALQFVAQVINKKNTLPILDNVVLKVSKDVVCVTGSDTETQLTVKAPLLESCNDATLCVRASDLLRILSRLKGCVLTLESEGNTLHGAYDGGTLDMECESADDYPWLTPNVVDICTFHATPSVISTAIKSTLFATARNEIRQIMTGVYFGFGGGTLKCVGTDGRCLVKYSDERVLCVKEDASFVMPKKPASIMSSIFAATGNTSVIDCSFNDKNATFSDNTFSMTCRLIEGRYPNFDVVIPQDNSLIAYVNRNKLIDTLSRVSVFAPESELVNMRFDNDRLTISCQNIDFAKSSKETISCSYQYEPLEIGFKYSFLNAVLNNLSCDDVVFKLKNPSTAAIIEPHTTSSDNDVHILSLVMPMKID